MQQNKGRGRGLSIILLIGLMLIMFYMLRTSNVDKQAYSEIIEKFKLQQIVDLSLTRNGKLTTYIPTPEGKYEPFRTRRGLLEHVKPYKGYNDAHYGKLMVYNYVAASMAFQFTRASHHMLLVVSYLFCCYDEQLGGAGGGKIAYS